MHTAPKFFSPFIWWMLVSAHQPELGEHQDAHPRAEEPAVDRDHELRRGQTPEVQVLESCFSPRPALRRSRQRRSGSWAMNSAVAPRMSQGTSARNSASPATSTSHAPRSPPARLEATSRNAASVRC